MSELSYLRDEINDLRRQLESLEVAVSQLLSDTVLQTRYDGFEREVKETLDSYAESLTMLNQAILGAGGDAGRRLDELLKKRHS